MLELQQEKLNFKTLMGREGKGKYHLSLADSNCSGFIPDLRSLLRLRRGYDPKVVMRICMIKDEGCQLKF